MAARLVDLVAQLRGGGGDVELFAFEQVEREAQHAERVVQIVRGAARGGTQLGARLVGGGLGHAGSSGCRCGQAAHSTG